MPSRMSYEYMGNKFAQDGDPFMFSTKQDEERDKQIDKIVEDIKMDLEYLDRRAVMNTSPPCSMDNTMNNIPTEMMDLDVNQLKNLINVDQFIRPKHSNDRKCKNP